MEIIHEIKNNIAIFKFIGNIEIYESEDIRKNIFQLIKEKNYNLIIFDFEKLEFIDSTGISIFLNLCSNFKNIKKFRFCNMKKNIKRVFDYTNLISCFTIDDTLEESIENIKKK